MLTTSQRSSSHPLLTFWTNIFTFAFKINSTIKEHIALVFSSYLFTVTLVAPVATLSLQGFASGLPGAAASDQYWNCNHNFDRDLFSTQLTGISANTKD